ncbi:hypothetical protein ACFL53_05295 [Pseudomonadota bacterium]
MDDVDWVIDDVDAYTSFKQASVLLKMASLMVSEISNKPPNLPSSRGVSKELLKNSQQLLVKQINLTVNVMDELRLSVPKGDSTFKKTILLCEHHFLNLSTLIQQAYPNTFDTIDDTKAKVSKLYNRAHEHKSAQEYQRHLRENLSVYARRHKGEYAFVMRFNVGILLYIDALKLLDVENCTLKTAKMDRFFNWRGRNQYTGVKILLLFRELLVVQGFDVTFEINPLNDGMSMGVIMSRHDLSAVNDEFKKYSDYINRFLDGKNTASLYATNHTVYSMVEERTNDIFADCRDNCLRLLSDSRF